MIRIFFIRDEIRMFCSLFIMKKTYLRRLRSRYHLLIPDHGCHTNNNGIVQLFLVDFLQLFMISFFSFRGKDELGGNRYRKYRLQYRYMKVKIGREPVPGTPKIGTELVLRILRFGKFSTGTQ
ncbi:hypothetical protein Hanom_Chr17g01566801 [Helianthus anomalus]